MLKSVFYKLYERMWNNTVHIYFVSGTKKDLYAFIGYLYSNSIEEIIRIDYEVMKDTSNIDKYFIVLDSGHVIIKTDDTECGLRNIDNVETR